MDEKQKSQPVKQDASDEVEVMKAYGIGTRKDGKKVYYGGGHFIGVLPNGDKFRMVPGQVRKLPRQVVDRYNAGSSLPTFVPPGSQKKGEEVKGAAK